MVAPVSDLGTSIVSRNFIDEYGVGHARLYELRHRFRQKKPFNIILPYDSERRYLHAYSLTSVSASLPHDTNSTPYFTVQWTPVTNRSYEKLRGKIYDKVGAGVDFAEYRQSVGMIASTATTLYKAYRAVRQLRFGDAAAALRMKFVPKGVAVHKSVGNNWLEFHFGWEPLYKDIHEALEVINDPVKSFSMERARAKDIVKQTGFQSFGATSHKWWANGYQSCTQGARVKFSKPGATHTLDQWGISNPAVIVWELVPFSFVVDWFVNIGNFLESQTDFAGMQIESMFRTLKLDVTEEIIGIGTPAGIGQPTWRSSSIIRYVNVSRVASLSGVALSVKKIKPPSLTRAATAISLLLQGMK
jgi:hypothetical protein